MKLLDAIVPLDTDRKLELAARWHVALDSKKRISVDEQIARGLVLLPRWLERGALSDGAREAMRLLCASPRGLARSALPPDVERLVEDGFVFPDPVRHERLVLPSAFRLQLPESPSDSPLSARVLLLDVKEDARRELCVHHLKRVAPLPWAMLLETVLERLEDPAWLKAEIAALSDPERALLLSIDALGGSVTAEEVLELEREPSRISHAGNLNVPRRSAIYALARRGLVLTRTAAWVMPDEVERVIGGQRRARAANDRQRLFMNRHMYELSPPRAELADAPGVKAVALLSALAGHAELPAEGKGMSRAAVRRAAQQLLIEPGRAELLACLSRSDGLSRAPVPLSLASARLWRAWRRGGAWDEAAREPDLFRPGHPATAKATALLRESLLEVLLLLPATEFALVSDVEASAVSDRRAVSAQRLLTQAARAGQEILPHALDVVRVLLERSLPGLGLVDRGNVEQGNVVRMAPSARAWLERGVDLDEHNDTHEPAAVWLSDDRLSCGARCDVAAIVEAGVYGVAWADDHAVGLIFSQDSLGRASEHDPDLAGLRASLSTLSKEVPKPLEASMHDAVAHRPYCSVIEAFAFVEIDDPDLRDALYRDPAARDVWAGPRLAEGLLVRPGISRERLHELLTRHGARMHLGRQAGDLRSGDQS